MTHALPAHQRLSKLRRYVNASVEQLSWKKDKPRQAIGKEASTSQIALEGLTSFALSTRNKEL